MNLSKRISVALVALALVLIAGAGSAFAATTPIFNVTTAPTEVANTGRSEVMGQVTLSADITCGTAADTLCTSSAGTIQVTYDRTGIDNSSTTGITICENIAAVLTCNVAGPYLQTGLVTVNNVNATTTGGVIAFSVLGGVDFAAGDQITISGVRGQIDLSLAGSEIRSILTTSPSTIAGFQPTNEVVARPKDPLTITTVNITNIAQCLPGVGTTTIRITEGFSTAFVDHGDTTETSFGGAPLNPRPLFGGTNNTRVNLVVTSLPSGVSITWPPNSSFATSGARLDLIGVSGTGNSTATYVFSSPNQASSDVTSEVFDVVLNRSAPINFVLSNTVADFGTALVQGQLFPPATPTGVRPRYNHPLEPVPPATLITIGPCTTNLLFPWVLNFAGLDTGIAISNTSKDPYGTLPQEGQTCTLTMWPTDKTTNNGVSGGAAVALTTLPIAAGSVWRSTISGNPVFAGLAGYIIAVCRFQFGHGFAFITDNFGVGAPGTAQGYLAEIIPDPTVMPGGARSATNVGLGFLGQPPVGEGLGN
jgi:hypothetical protein